MGLRRVDASHVTRAVRRRPATIHTTSISPASRQARPPLTRTLCRVASSDNLLRRLPLELGAVTPDRVEDDSQLARHSNGGTLPSNPLGETQRPCLERTRSSHARHEHAGGLIQVAAKQRIVGLADAADPLALTGLILPRCQAEIGADLG